MATYVDPRKFKPITDRFVGEAIESVGDDSGTTLPIEIGDVTGLETALSSKANVEDIPNISNLATTSTLTTGLAGKANTTHTHTIANVTGLQSALDVKGTSSLTIGTTSTTAKAGDYTPSVADIPSLPTSKITSGVFLPARIPVATDTAIGGVKVGAAVVEAVDETDVVAQLNALLVSLRAAGVITE